jgi:hypothetical protein
VFVSLILNDIGNTELIQQFDLKMKRCFYKDRNTPFLKEVHMEKSIVRRSIKTARYAAMTYLNAIKSGAVLQFTLIDGSVYNVRVCSAYDMDTGKALTKKTENLVFEGSMKIPNGEPMKVKGFVPVTNNGNGGWLETPSGW